MQEQFRAAEAVAARKLQEMQEVWTTKEGEHFRAQQRLLEDAQLRSQQQSTWSAWNSSGT